MHVYMQAYYIEKPLSTHKSTFLVYTIGYAMVVYVLNLVLHGLLCFARVIVYYYFAKMHDSNLQSGKMYLSLL